MMLRRLAPCTCAPGVCTRRPLIGWRVTIPDLSLVQHSVSCRHHSSKTQSLVPVPVLRDARVTYIQLPLLILVTSLSLIGSDWLPWWHDSSTKVATHYTTKSPILLENHEYAASCSCQWMKTFNLFKDFILLKIWTENVILLKNGPNLRFLFPKLIAMVTIKRTMSWMKLFCC